MEGLGLATFYKGKRVFVTGHTGFKGSWLCLVLLRLGAQVTGYALAPEGDNLFDVCGVEGGIQSIIGDVRDGKALADAYRVANPDVVLHLAAQPLVQEGYQNPSLTYETNVMGTVNLLDCIRQHPGAGSVINITTDKVYSNQEWPWGYRETDILDGHDPYSNSKSCSELVTNCYRSSFFSKLPIGITTMRAGNVIGGGDFAKNRIVPDCIRAAQANQAVLLRNPHATRPYQHVLEPLFAYLLVAQKQYQAPEWSGAYNVGPEQEDSVSNSRLAQLFCDAWGEGMRWEAPDHNDCFAEANMLKLDCAQLTAKLGWKPRWGIQQAVEKTVEWTRAYMAGERMDSVMQRQIDDFILGGTQHA